MDVKIYDYKNNARSIHITKPIARIDVDVISGDEVVTFTYSDGSVEEFDACTGRRFCNFYDGGYMLFDSDEIEKWLNYIPSEDVKERVGTTAYERLNIFREVDEE